MCGVCGFLSKGQADPPSSKVLEEMVTALKHRGPDSQTIHTDGPLGLGHARLAIIDLEASEQPLFNEDKTVALICNGEIYNYRELRKELIEAGHRFQTNGDCEVLVHLWEQHGAAMLDRLRGMFAFVLYDGNRKVLFGARDQFGQKPLFYMDDRELFAFASEIKGLLCLPNARREIDAAALDQFLFYQHVPHPRTMFQNVRQLPPGHFFCIENDTLRIERYWSPKFDPDTSLDDEEHIERVETALVDAVQSHLVSDVPVGVFLSGGIDSSLIVAVAATLSNSPLQSFSISFRGTTHDESEFARIASRRFNTIHREIAFEPASIRHCLETIAPIFDQPLADSAAMPLLSLSELAAQEVKVVLTGDGGDELFGGYRKYRRAASMLANLSLSAGLDRWPFATERLAMCGPDPLRLRRLRSRAGMLVVPTQRSSYHRNYWEGWDRHRLYNRETADRLSASFTSGDAAHAAQRQHLHPIYTMLHMDQTGYLPDDLLLKTDYSTMAHSLEARAPLLDPQLAAAAYRLPPHLIVSSRQTKVALRRIAERRLPPELSTRPKKGFSFPIGSWFRNELRSWVQSSLLDSSTTVPRHFKADFVRRMLDEHNSGRRDHRGRIYTLLTFELWHRHYLK